MKSANATKRLTLASACLAGAVLAMSCLTMAGADTSAGNHSSSRTVGAARSYSCSAVISCVYDNGATESYEKNFSLKVGDVFEDDFSTPTREHVFDAEASMTDAGVLFDFAYFSDVTAISTIDLATSLTMHGEQKTETVTGRHQSYHALSGAYTVNYSITCSRR